MRRKKAGKTQRKNNVIVPPKIKTKHNHDWNPWKGVRPVEKLVRRSRTPEETAVQNTLRTLYGTTKKEERVTDRHVEEEYLECKEISDVKEITNGSNEPSCEGLETYGLCFEEHHEALVGTIYHKPVNIKRGKETHRKRGKGAPSKRGKEAYKKKGDDAQPRRWKVAPIDSQSLEEPGISTSEEEKQSSGRNLAPIDSQSLEEPVTSTLEEEKQSRRKKLAPIDSKSLEEPAEPNAEEENITPDPPELKTQEEGGEDQHLESMHNMRRRQVTEEEEMKGSMEKWKRILDSNDTNTNLMDAVKKEMEALQEIKVFSVHSTEYNTKRKHEQKYRKPRFIYVGHDRDKRNVLKIANLIMRKTTPVLGVDISEAYIRAQTHAEITTIHGPKPGEDQNSKERKIALANSKVQEEMITTKKRKLNPSHTRILEEPDPPDTKEGKQTMHAHQSHTKGWNVMRLDRQE